MVYQSINAYNVIMLIIVIIYNNKISEWKNARQCSLLDQSLWVLQRFGGLLVGPVNHNDTLIATYCSGVVSWLQGVAHSICSSQCLKRRILMVLRVILSRKIARMGVSWQPMKCRARCEVRGASDKQIQSNVEIKFQGPVSGSGGWSTIIYN